jgi:hypothetical protein
MSDSTHDVNGTGAVNALDAADRERRASREATAWDAALAAALAAKAGKAAAPETHPDGAQAGPPAGASHQADGYSGAAD